MALYMACTDEFAYAHFQGISIDTCVEKTPAMAASLVHFFKGSLSAAQWAGDIIIFQMCKKINKH